MARLGTRPIVFLGAVALLVSVVGTPSGPASATTMADLTPPIVDSLTSPLAVLADADDYDVPVSFTWSGHDPEGSSPLTYDLRYGAASTLSDSYTWPLVLDHSGATTWSTTLRWYDDDICVQVRARDAFANTSAWSQPRCTVLDNSPPWAYAVLDPYLYGPTAHVHQGLTTTPVSYRFGAEDDDQVASYDVDVRRISPAGVAGPWTSPPAWQGTSATSVSMAAPAGDQLCFRARARDRAGRISQLLSEWCKVVPYDDRDFTMHDGAKRVRVAGALGGTVTKGKRLRGSMYLRHISGSDVWVRVMGRLATACVHVTLGRRHGGPGCLLQSVPGAVWQNFHFRPGTHGRLRIRTNLLVDAVAVRPTTS